MKNVHNGPWNSRQISSTGIAPPPVPVYDEPMTDFTRQELDARFKENEAKIATSEAKVSERLAHFDASIKTGFAELATAMAKQAAAMEKQTDALRVEMAKQSGDIRSEMANVRADQHKGTIDIVKWVIGFGLATVGALVGIWRVADKLPSEQDVRTPVAISAPTEVRPPVAAPVRVAPDESPVKNN